MELGGAGRWSDDTVGRPAQAEHPLNKDSGPIDAQAVLVPGHQIRELPRRRFCATNAGEQAGARQEAKKTHRG